MDSELLDQEDDVVEEIQEETEANYAAPDDPGNQDVVDETPGEELPPDSAEQESGEGGDKPHEFSPELLQAMGMDADDLRQKGFKDDASLEAALNWQIQTAIGVGNSSRQQQQPPPQQAGQNYQQQQQVPPAEDGAKQALDKLRYELNLDPENWDEETRKVLTGINEHYGSVLENMGSQLFGAVQRSQQVETALQMIVQQQVEAESEAYYDRFDDRVNGLPDAYKETFGSGDRKSLKPGSSEFVNRAKLDELVGTIQRGRKSQGQSELPEDQAFQWALRAGFSNIHDAAVRQDLSGKAQRRQSQMTARPTTRRGKALSKEEQAMNTVESFFGDKGIPLVPDTSDEFGGV